MTGYEPGCGGLCREERRKDEQENGATRNVSGVGGLRDATQRYEAPNHARIVCRLNLQIKNLRSCVTASEVDQERKFLLPAHTQTCTTKGLELIFFLFVLK